MYLIFIRSGNASEECDDSDEDSEENLIFDEYSDEEQTNGHSVNGHAAAGKILINKIVYFSLSASECNSFFTLTISDSKTNGHANGFAKKLKKPTNIQILNKCFQDQYHMMQVIKVCSRK